MKKQRIFYCELAYAIGIFILAFGTALMERANFGMSMVVAPAYLIHLKVSEFLPFFSFGMSEYLFQAFLLIVLSVVMGKFRKSYLFAFATAILYGLALDLALALVGFFPYDTTLWHTIFYIGGLLAGSLGVALLFHTYIPLEAYEMFVKDLSEKTGATIPKIKTIYDCCSCALGIILSFAFFGLGVFMGVKWGTIVCAIVNGWLIGRISKWLEKTFQFQDALPLRDTV